MKKKHLLFSLDVTDKYHNIYNVTDLYYKILKRNIQDVDIKDVDPINCDYSFNQILKASGVIISGSKYSVNDNLPWIDKLKNLLIVLDNKKIPVLGICFGHQLISLTFGGKVEKTKEYKIGSVPLNITVYGKKDPLFYNFNSRDSVLYSHFDYVTKLPSNAILLANTEFDPYSSFKLRNMWGVQFHPELTGDLLSSLMLHLRSILSPFFNYDDKRLEKKASDISKSVSFGDLIIKNFCRYLLNLNKLN